MSLSSSLSSLVNHLRSLLRQPASPAQLYLTSLGGALTLLGLWLIHDKRSWVAFGTGGTPPTWAGYYRANVKFRLLRLLALDPLHDTTALKRKAAQRQQQHAGAPAAPSFLSGPLPTRPTPRPAINAWTLPQRQRRYQTGAPDVPADPEVLQRLHGLVHELGTAHADVLDVRPSKTEGRSVAAIYARDGEGSVPGRHHTARDPIIGDEIAHVHREEHSLHVWLSEADAIEVVDKGWGERFPLSSLGMVHDGLTFVYAPTTGEEVDVVEKIIKAGIKYVTGKDV